MTANISATTNKGTTSPVDSFAPNANAIKVTLIMAIPLIPAFESPMTNAAVKAIAHAIIDISDVVDRVKAGI